VNEPYPIGVDIIRIGLEPEFRLQLERHLRAEMEIGASVARRRHELLKTPRHQFVHHFKERNHIALAGSIGADQHVERAKLERHITNRPKAADGYRAKS